MQSLFKALIDDIEREVVGRSDITEQLIIAVLARGHVLLEGLPGLAKTRLIRALAKRLEGDFARIQATPDLLPSDITGSEIYQQNSGEFSFSQGPVFNDWVLVDEINRAPPKVQAGLLEAMAEHQVSVFGTTHALSELFTVFATQNPLDSEGTYPLPKAQLDRFLFYIHVDLPDAQLERQILDTEIDSIVEPTVKLTQEQIIKARLATQAVELADVARDYIVRLVMATRDKKRAETISAAASPRATLAIAASAKVHAWLHGRDYVDPIDIQFVTPSVLHHRVQLTFNAIADGISVNDIIDEIIDQVVVLQ